VPTLLTEAMQSPDVAPSPPGLIRRLGALFYDAVLLLGILFFATLALLPFRKGMAFQANTLAYDAYLIGVAYLFFGWCWTHGGQTLGMRAWKIRLCHEAGGAVGWHQASLRFLAASISLALFGLGFLWALWDPDKRCWHDRIAHTRMLWSG